jgi:phosphate/sulfate permease
MSAELSALDWLHIALALMVFVCCAASAGTDDNSTASGNTLVNASQRAAPDNTISPTQTLPKNMSGKAKLAAIDSSLQYKENMTEWQRKTSTQILYLIDPKFPEMGVTREQMKRMMRDQGQLLYASEAIKTFTIQNVSGHSIGDHVFVTIDINASASSKHVESYATNIYGIYEEVPGINRVVAWVDLNNVERISTLKEVHRIELVIRAETATVITKNSFAYGGSDIQNISNPALTSLFPVTTHRVSETHTAPVSLMSTVAAITGTGVIAVFRRIL